QDLSCGYCTGPVPDLLQFRCPQYTIEAKLNDKPTPKEFNRWQIRIKTFFEDMTPGLEWHEHPDMFPNDLDLDDLSDDAVVKNAINRINKRQRAIIIQAVDDDILDVIGETKWAPSVTR
ncbi:hypothetical protein HDV05_001547, partial [Chytridiales sp. JEL 0842]